MKVLVACEESQEVCWRYRYVDFGKTVFLSREEAEAALEERNER